MLQPSRIVGLVHALRRTPHLGARARSRALESQFESSLFVGRAPFKETQKFPRLFPRPPGAGQANTLDTSLRNFQGSVCGELASYTRAKFGSSPARLAADGT